MSKDNSGVTANATPAANTSGFEATNTTVQGGVANPEQGNSFFGGNKSAPEFASFIPEEYRNDPVFKDYKTVPDFFKSHKNLSSMIGKKAIEAPGENATPEQIKAFHSAIGVPETVEGYQFEDVDFSKLGGDADAFKKELGDFKEVFHKLGIPPKAANELQKIYWNKLGESLEAIRGKGAQGQAEAQAAQDKDFVAQIKTKFGDKADEVTAKASELLKEFASPEEIEAMKTLDNKTLAILIGTLNGVREKYMSEGDLPNNGGKGSSSFQNEDALRNQSKAIYSKMIAPGMNPMSAEYQDLHNQYKEIQNKLNSLPFEKK